jgi:hypothetical protein
MQARPEGVDFDALALDLCKEIMPNCGDVYVSPSGDCGCGENPKPDEATPEDLCRDDQISRCLDDVMAGVSLRGGACGCQPLDAGTKPWGGLGCRLDPKALLGSRDKWLTKRHDDIFVNRVFDIPGAADPKRDVLAFRQGFIAASSTPLNRTFFTKLGSQLTVDVVTPATRPASGYGGALQAYCTRGNAVVNRFLGQVELSPLADGRLHTVNIPVSSTNRTACFDTSSDFTITFAVNSEPNAPGTIGLANFDFGGTPFPVGNPNPVCPDPSPVQEPKPFPTPWVTPVAPGTFDVGDFPWIQECGAFGC